MDTAAHALMDRVAAGDRAAFAELYDSHAKRVFGFVRRRVPTDATAEDLTSEVFIAAWRTRGNFTWQGSDPIAWLLTIARSKIADHYKSARVRREQATDTLPDLPPATTTDGDPAAAAAAARRAAAVRSALDELSEAHGEVLRLRFLDGLSTRETAAVLGRSPGATRVLQHRALKALCDSLEHDPDLAAWAAELTGGSASSLS